MHTRRALPTGEYWRATDHGTVKPYREIVEWVDREGREFPPDPEEPAHGLDPETWAKIRHPEPHSSAIWFVKLSCGHFTRPVVDVDWKPEDGPEHVPTKRLTKIRSDYEEHWATEGPTVGPEESGAW